MTEGPAMSGAFASPVATSVPPTPVPPCGAGPALVFELGPGSRDIAGLAVSTASKLAQDRGVFGRSYVSDAAGRGSL